MTHDWPGVRIGVLMGGPSAERDVSLRSGQAIGDALRRQGVAAAPVVISSRERAEEEILAAAMQVAFIALHGPFGEDGEVQALLERLGIPYTGSGVAASRRAMDKVASTRLFQEAGLTVPRSVVLHRGELFASLNGLRCPVVVKPACQGSSLGVSVVRDLDELAPALDLAYQFGEVAMVEDLIEGAELTVGLLDDQPLPVIQIVPKRPFYDYPAKYQAGLTEYLVPAPIAPEAGQAAQAAAARAHRALGCQSFSRVDIISTRAGAPVILEINTIPGMTATSLLPKAAQAAGLDFDHLCLRMLNSALTRVMR